MFGTFALTALLASASVLLVRADVVPTVPGPGIVYKEGGTCHIEWTGDAASTTAWKNMAIELMTGNNFQMVHLTTVATGLDGTVTGSFDHPCPAVTPNSAIYFYQFTAPGATAPQWATRFTIASPDGTTTPPTDATQPPPSNAAIPWGTGALKDPSKAVPPPNFANGTAGVTTSVPSLPACTDSPPTPRSVDPVTSSATATTSRFVTVTTSSTSTAAPTASPSTNSTNTTTVPKPKNAASPLLGSRAWKAAVALGASAVAFAVLM